MSAVKILVVDDDEAICKSLSMLLQRKGYIVETRNSGPEAVKALNKSNFDVLLTDLNMPEMSGIELLKIANKITSRMIKIIMTGYGDIKSYLDAMDIGTAEYINKPIQCDELDSIIKEFIKKERKKQGQNFDFISDSP